MQLRLDIAVTDGTADAQLFAPDGAGQWPGVIMFPDAGGIRPALEQMAARLAAAGHVVLLPNVYHRQGPFAPFDFKAVFTDAAERERLMALARSLDGAALLRDVDAFIATLTGRAEVSGTAVGCVGYCMGGRHALLAACRYPDRVAAAASIHGGGLVTDADDSVHRALAGAPAALYIGVADNDRGCTPEHQGELCRALAAASRRFAIELFPGAAHGFAVPDAAVFDSVAAARHFARITALFGETLGPG